MKTHPAPVSNSATKLPRPIGVHVPAPPSGCTDKHCPFHGVVHVRGRQFTGRIISDRMAKTVTVEWGRKKYWPKYERFEMLRSRVKAHNPACINARMNQIVRIMETRPLSKTKNFVVIQILGEKQVIAGEDFMAKKTPDTPDKKEAEKEILKGKKSEE